MVPDDDENSTADEPTIETSRKNCAVPSTPTCKYVVPATINEKFAVAETINCAEDARYGPRNALVCTLEGEIKVDDAAFDMATAPALTNDMAEPLMTDIVFFVTELTDAPDPTRNVFSESTLTSPNTVKLLPNKLPPATTRETLESEPTGKEATPPTTNAESEAEEPIDTTLLPPTPDDETVTIVAEPDWMVKTELLPTTILDEFDTDKSSKKVALEEIRETPTRDEANNWLPTRRERT
jgi:hypothetical protein